MRSVLFLFFFTLCTWSPPAAAAEDRSNLEPALLRHTQRRYAADLARIRREGVLRVLTRNNAAAYFLARGAQLGFEYELATHFAKELGVRVDMVVVDGRQDLLAALESGRGDLIAAGMTVTPQRERYVHFTPEVLSSPRVVVAHAGRPVADGSGVALEALDIHIRSGATSLTNLRQHADARGLALRIFEVPEDVEMEVMMARVAEGTYEATVVDRDLFAQEVAHGLPLLEVAQVSEPLSKAWAIPKGAKSLAVAADHFIKRSRRNGLIRILYGKYYKAGTRFAKTARTQAFRADQGGAISPWDEVFKREGARVGLDWRLLAAVAYIESRFRPEAKSNWGAVGLMQVLPSTGKEMGVTKLKDPAQNIKAGASYLRWLMDRFPGKQLAERQRVRFALAAYNAGVGHVRDARKLAEKTGRDRNRWFHNVADALMLKKDRRWHRKTRHGYCRADETVTYVSRVQARYEAYVRHVPVE